MTSTDKLYLRALAAAENNKKIEKPCRSYLRGHSCKDGRDHCFNCGRHLEPDTGRCPKNCGDNESVNDAANNED